MVNRFNVHKKNSTLVYFFVFGAHCEMDHFQSLLTSTEKLGSQCLFLVEIELQIKISSARVPSGVEISLSHSPCSSLVQHLQMTSEFAHNAFIHNAQFNHFFPSISFNNKHLHLAGNILFLFISIIYTKNWLKFKCCCCGCRFFLLNLFPFIKSNNNVSFSH